MWYESKRGGEGKFGGDWEKRGWRLQKEDGNCRKIQKSDYLLGNLDLFIASIYMKSRKKNTKRKNASGLLFMLWQR